MTDHSDTLATAQRESAERLLEEMDHFHGAKWDDDALSGGESTYCDKCESVECGCGDVQREAEWEDEKREKP